MMTVPDAAVPQDTTLAEVLEIRRLLHDLSNVLTGLLISAGLLKNFVPLTGHGGRYASDIEISAERSAALVSDVRTLVHRVQASISGVEIQRTKVCDVRPSLGHESGEN